MNKPIIYIYKGVRYIKTERKYYDYSCDNCDLNIKNKCLLITNDKNMLCGMDYLYKKDIIEIRKEKLLKIFKKF